MGNTQITRCFILKGKQASDKHLIAHDVSQSKHGQVVYISSWSLFIEFANSLGIQSILPNDATTTRAKLAASGLVS